MMPGLLVRAKITMTLSLLLGYMAACSSELSDLVSTGIKMRSSDAENNADDRQILQNAENNDAKIIQIQASKSEQANNNTVLLGSISVEAAQSEIVNLSSSNLVGSLYSSDENSEFEKSGEAVYISAGQDGVDSKNLVGQFDILLPSELSANESFGSQKQLQFYLSDLSDSDLKYCDLFVFYFIKCDSTMIGSLPVFDNIDSAATSKDNAVRVSPTTVALKYMCPGYYQVVKNCSGKAKMSFRSIIVDQDPLEVRKNEIKFIENKAIETGDESKSKKNYIEEITFNTLSGIKETENLLKEDLFVDTSEEDVSSNDRNNTIPVDNGKTQPSTSANEDKESSNNINDKEKYKNNNEKGNSSSKDNNSSSKDNNGNKGKSNYARDSYQPNS